MQKLMAVWKPKPDKPPQNALLVRHEEYDERPVLVDETAVYKPEDTHGEMIRCYVFQEPDQEVIDFLVEARQRGYNVSAVDARVQGKWKEITIPNVRIVR